MVNTRIVSLVHVLHTLENHAGFQIACAKGSICMFGWFNLTSQFINSFIQCIWYLPINDLKIRICFNICKVYFYKISYQSSFCCCHFKDICLFLLRITYTSSTFCKWKVFVFFTLRCIFIFVTCFFILTKIVHYICI